MLRLARLVVFVVAALSAVAVLAAAVLIVIGKFGALVAIAMQIAPAWTT